MMLQVRRRALEVMEAVLRGGVMPPFSAVPTLFALTTDPTRYYLVPFYVPFCVPVYPMYVCALVPFYASR